ncbi:flagellar basal body P-ring formation chaperone FlgA [Gemmobacter serpentinus]|uniref:flagellar basal body P-ring formation chaperone FlgA n=1 Tax=Gemmobacter serpentinus TaxID=2652247 RepID=UPI00124E2290|nr:flagellar basal body P-ring formation chaperone FlgA [Gemmobacter serpentinus]
MRWPILIALLAQPAIAESVAPARTIRAATVIAAADLAMVPQDLRDGFQNPDEVVGQEARVTLYAGRPIRMDEIGPPALVDRNQIVTLTYHVSGLRIAAEGRSLARGGVGDMIRVMNLSSRSTVTGSVRADGTVAAIANSQ